jgi:LysM repeat protein
MKMPWVISIVIAAHLAVAALLFQGCGTMQKGSEPVAGGATKMPDVAVEPAKNLPPPPPPMMDEVRETSKPVTTAYVVQKGDSLSLICKRYHLKTAEVMAMNGVKDANKLRVGQKLVLPGAVNLQAPKPVRKAVAKKTAKPAAAVAAAGSGGYVVKSGDSLSMIAAKHGVKTAALRAANNLSGDKIRVGQKLTIPGSAATPAAEPAVAPAAPAAVPAESVPEAAPVGEVKPAEAVSSPAAAPAAGQAPASSGREHTVEQGEDLYTVAMTYGVDVSDLKKLNGLTDTALTPGQKIKIPATE